MTMHIPGCDRASVNLVRCSVSSPEERSGQLDRTLHPKALTDGRPSLYPTNETCLAATGLIPGYIANRLLDSSVRAKPVTPSDQAFPECTVH